MRPHGSHPPGCLGVALGVVAALGLAPAAALVRWWRRVRRGADVRVHRRWADAGGGRAGLTVELDSPLANAAASRRALTGTIVKLASMLRRPDDVYHLVFRDRPDGETVLVAIGPRLQDLGDRFHQALGRGAWERSTLVWLALPRGTALAEVVDAAGFDPDRIDEARALLERAPLHWGMLSERAVGPASELVRIEAVLPEADRDAAEAIVAGLESSRCT